MCMLNAVMMMCVCDRCMMIADHHHVEFVMCIRTVFHHAWIIMKNSLKNNGQIVLLEYRAEDPSVPIKALHKMSLKQITREMDYVGMKLSKNIQELPRQHMLVFSKL